MSKNHKLIFILAFTFNSLFSMEEIESNQMNPEIEEIIKLFNDYSPVSDPNTNSNAIGQFACASQIKPKYKVGYLVMRKMRIDNLIKNDDKFDKNIINTWIKNHQDEVLGFIYRSKINKKKNNSNKKTPFVYGAIPLIVLETAYILYDKGIKSYHLGEIKKKLNHNFEASLKEYESRIPKDIYKKISTTTDKLNIEELSQIISKNTNPFQKIIECIKDILT